MASRTAAEATAGTVVMARILDITPRRLQQLAKDDTLPQVGRGRFEIYPTVQRYIRYLRARQAGADVGPDGVQEHRTRLAKARADNAELEVKQRRGELMDVGDVSRTWAGIVGLVRGRLLSLATKITPRVMAAKRRADGRAILHREVMDILDELSRGDIANGNGRKKT